MTENAGHAARTAAAQAPNAAGFGARHRRGYVLAMAIGVVMAIIAPLQTDFIAFWPRLAYWQILMISGATLGLGITQAVERWGRLRAWPWLEVPLIGILIALPLTMIVMGAGAMFFGASAAGIFRFSYNFAITALISVAITALGHAIQSGRDAGVNVTARVPLATPSEPAPVNTFAERLPLGQRGLAVTALEAEDHYLRVHLAGGQSVLLLMRLSDAIAELPAALGAQTHRSWWVARAAVCGVSKADGRATLSLTDGISAPVSRSFYKDLSAAGWLV